MFGIKPKVLVAGLLGGLILGTFILVGGFLAARSLFGRPAPQATSTATPSGAIRGTFTLPTATATNTVTPEASPTVVTPEATATATQTASSTPAPTLIATKTPPPTSIPPTATAVPPTVSPTVSVPTPTAQPTSSPPQAPTNLVAEGSITTRITLTWVNVSADAAGVRIIQDGQVLATVGPNTTFLIVDGLQPWSHHCYQVEAFNSTGATARSGATCANADCGEESRGCPTAVSGG